MGEAKNRKTNDCNYGKVPKKAHKRGIVVSPPIEIDGSSLFIKLSNIDPQELRFSLLFWDKLVWPSSRNIHIASGFDERFLESEGILERPDYTVNGDGAQGIAYGQLLAFRDLESKDPGCWSLAQGEKSFLLKNGLATEENGALLELHRAIPIPKLDVPLPEILEFKLRRKDELLFFRYKMEDFLNSIENAADREDEITKCLKEIDSACSDLILVGKEFQFPMHLSNLKANFSLSPMKLLPAVCGAFKIGEPYGLTAATSAAAVAGIASTIEIKADIGFRSIKRPKSPFRYAYHIGHEL